MYPSFWIKAYLNILTSIFLINNLQCAQENNNTNYAKRLPQAIIIGAKKCGTRALLKFIGAHPNVSTAGAELHFFDRFYHMGLDWYREQMPYSLENQVTIEKTPKYLIDKQVPERVYQMNPNIKLIVVLRNPVTRAISEYVQGQWRKKRFIDSSNFPHTISNQTKRSTVSTSTFKKLTDSQRFEQMLYDKRFKNRTIKSNWAVVRNGIYIQHLKQWLKHFPRENFLFINGEQLIKEPSVELNKLQLFLNLKQMIKKEHFVHNKRKGFACILKPLDSKQVKCLSDQKGRTHPVVDQKILDDLNKFYRPYNQQLFEFLQQDPWWPV
jgi:hypothetical protein